MYIVRTNRLPSAGNCFWLTVCSDDAPRLGIYQMHSVRTRVVGVWLLNSASPTWCIASVNSGSRSLPCHSPRDCPTHWDWQEFGPVDIVRTNRLPSAWAYFLLIVCSYTSPRVTQYQMNNTFSCGTVRLQTAPCKAGSTVGRYGAVEGAHC